MHLAEKVKNLGFILYFSSHSPHPVNKFGVKTVLQELLASLSLSWFKYWKSLA